MKWNKAVSKIEDALHDGANVGVVYYRKHMVNDRHIQDVDSVGGYEWNGHEAKCIHVSGNILDESNSIIDEVLVDYYFGTKFEE